MLANAGHALASIFSRMAGENKEPRDWRPEIDDGYGKAGSGEGPRTRSLANARTTRAKTYMQI
jgi:hypothetical protein